MKEWKITNTQLTGSVEIVGDNLVFNEKPTVTAMMAGRGVQGRKSIPIRNITSIQVKAASLISPGYINFSYIGGKEFKGGLMEATRDPDTLLFNKARNTAVQEFAAEVERRRDEAHATPAASAQSAAPSVADEIAKLAALRVSGALTEEEFVAAKRKALGAT
jgi:hypothetical protein